MTELAPYTLLAWDSEFFGMRVCRVDDARASDAALTFALDRARSDGFALAYWLASHDRGVGDAILQRFGGVRIAGHRIYGRQLEAAAAAPRAKVSSWLGRGVTPALRALAQLAGHLSRFRVDLRLPPGSCDRMYDLWLSRSLSGEIATDVLVAENDAGAAIGLVTLRIVAHSATIGLLAVAPEAQGRGLGRSLLAAAEQRARKAGADRIEVATQAENVDACRLYERGDYAIVTDGHYHHFLLKP